MKKIAILAAATALLFTACKKDEDNGPSGDSWTVNGTTYSGTVVAANGIISASNGTNGVSVTFGTLPSFPSASGNIKVVNAPAAADELSIVVTDGTIGGTYKSTGNDNQSATVTVSDGKVSVNVPEVWATNGTDSIKISANLVQP